MLHVVSLHRPIISKRVSNGRICTPEENGGVDRVDHFKHLFLPNYIHKMGNGRNVHIINYQQSARGNVWIQEIVFEFRNWVGVCTIEQDSVKHAVKRISRQCVLRTANYKPHVTLVQKRALLYSPKRVPVACIVACKDNVFLTQMREEQSALAGSCLS